MPFNRRPRQAVWKSARSVKARRDACLTAAVVETLEKRVLLSGLSFSTSTLNLSVNVEAVTTAYLQGNTHPADIVAVNSNGTISVFLGNGDGTFKSPTTINDGLAPDPGYSASIAVANLGNGSGTLADVLVTDDQAGGNVSVLLGNGDGSFKSATLVSTNSGGYGADHHSGMIVTNLGNGTEDLVVGLDNGGVAVLLGNGDGTFETGFFYQVSSNQTTSLAVADINGDGIPDIITADKKTGYAYALYGVGGGNFNSTAVQITKAGVGNVYSVQAAGLGNSNSELVVTHQGGSITVLLDHPSNGAASFSPKQSINTLAVYAVTTLTDVNGDGKPDIVVAYETSITSAKLQVFFAIGAGTFSNLPFTTNVTNIPTSLAIAPVVNGNSNADLLLGFPGRVGVALGNGSGLFAAPTNLLTGINEQPEEVVATNLNGTKVGAGGDVDLVTVNYDGSVSVLLGNGDGTFSQPITYSDGLGLGKARILAADLTGNDGNPLDLVVAGGTLVSVLVGDGTDNLQQGLFQTPFTYGLNSPAYSIAVGNVNGDGGNAPAYLAVGLGNGNVEVLQANFSNVSNTGGLYNASYDSVAANSANSAIKNLALADVNDDGVPDLVAADNAGNIYTLLGNRDGSFGTATLIYSAGTKTNLSTADVNADGNADLLLAVQPGTLDELLGNGGGSFSFKQIATGLGSNKGRVIAADLNGDGKPDLILSNYANNDVMVFPGNGNGTFQLPQTFPVGVGPADVVAAGLTGDSQFDLVAANFSAGSVTVLLNTSVPASGSLFGPPVTTGTGNKPKAVAVIGFNGHEDVVVANQYSNSVQIFLGNGDGGFSQVLTYHGFNNPRSLAVGDLNGDGRPDIVVGEDSGYIAILYSNAAGMSPGSYFNNAPTTLDAFSPDGSYGDVKAVAVGQLTGDGKMDVVAADYYSGNVSVLLHNAGQLAGFLSPRIQFTGQCGPDSVAIGTLFNGQPDIVVANKYSADVSVLLGNGSGNFQNAENFFAGENPNSGAIATLNGDGTPDIAVSDSTHYTPNGAAVAILLGNGDTFNSPTTITLPGEGAGTIAAADLVGNGREDLIVPSAFSGASAVQLNVLLSNGDGTFEPAVSYSTVGGGSLATGAFTTDGKPSIVSVSQSANELTLLPSLSGPAFNNDSGTFTVGTAGVVSVTTNPAVGTTITQIGGTRPTGVNLIGGVNGTASFSGTPSGAGGEYTVTLKATSSTSGTSTEVFTLTVDQKPTGIQTAGTTFTPNSDSVFDVDASGFPAVTFSEAGALPSGFALSNLGDNAAEIAPGVTPATGGTYPILLTATNSVGAASEMVTLTVDTVPTIVSVTPTTLYAGTLGAVSIATTGFPAPTISEAGALDGLTLVHIGVNSAALTGTPTSGGRFPISLSAANSFGTASASFVLTVDAPPAITRTGTLGFATSSINLGVNVVAIAAANLQGANKPADIVAVNTNSTISVFIGNGDGTFKTPTTIPDGLPADPGYGATIVIADLGNGNGTVADVLVTNDGQAAGLVSVLVGNGDGTFKPANLFPTNGNGSFIENGNMVVANLGGAHPDLVAGLDDGSVAVLPGNGDGTFGTATIYQVSSNDTTSLAVADVNGDGKPDILTADYYAGKAYALYGNGGGSFNPTPVQITQAGNNVSQMQAASLSGNKEELVLTHTDGTITVLVDHPGNGTFDFVQTQSISTGLDLSEHHGDLRLADVNGDGTPDILFGHSTSPVYGQLQVFLADGTGTFNPTPIVNRNTNAPQTFAIADVTNNNKADLLLGYAGAIGVLLGNGNGTFGSPVDPSTGQTEKPDDVIVTNVLGKHSGGNLDLVTANPDGSVTVLLGNGDGTFDPPLTYSDGLGPSGQAQVVAVEHDDGSNYDSTYLFVENGTDQISLLAPSDDGGHDLLQDPQLFNTAGDFGADSIAVGNIQGDDGGRYLAAGLENGSVEIAPINGYSNSDGNGEGNGAGILGAPTSIPVSNNAPITQLQINDVNDDGVPDLIATDADGRVFEVIGNRDGTFGTATMIFSSNGAMIASLTSADVNADGKADLLIGLSNGTFQELLGNGDGTFAAATTAATLTGNFAGNFAGGVIAAPVNGDGNPDLIVADEFTSDVMVFLGNGNGAFQLPKTFAVGYVPQSLTTADLNGDGELDLVTANFASGSVSVMLNTLNLKNDGLFIPPTTLSAGNKPKAVTTAEIDGHEDVVAANSYDNTVQVFVGNGDGTFEAPLTYTGFNYPTSVAVGDVNGDGAPDIVVGEGYNGGRVVVLYGNPAGNTPGSLFDAAPSVVAVLGGGNGSNSSQTVAVALGQLVSNNDELDIVATNYDSNTVSVLLNNQDQGFNSAELLPVGYGPTSVTIGTLANGHPDIVTANKYSASVSILLGNGNGTFNPNAETFFAGEEPSSVVLANLTGDGPDIVVANANYYTLDGAGATILAGNNVTGIYTVATTITLPGNRAGTALAEDLTNNGAQDLIVSTGFEGAPTDLVNVLLANADGSFQPAISYSVAQAPGSLASGDFNGDGRPDIVANAQDENELTLLLSSIGAAFNGNASATFTVGVAGSATITTTPASGVTLTEIGARPAGVNFASTHNGTASFSGTPSAGTGGTYVLTLDAASSSGTSSEVFTLTVDQKPAITSVGSNPLTAGVAGTIGVITTGFPGLTNLNATGALDGLTATVTGVNTAQLQGTPIAGGTYSVTLTAVNAAGSSAADVVKVTVDEAPTIAAPGSPTLTVGTHGTVGISVTGFPAATLTESGTLPSGVTFVDEHNNAGELVGTAGSGMGGTYFVTIDAINAVGAAPNEVFGLTVDQKPVFTAVGSNSLTAGTYGAINISTSGFPAAVYGKAGALPFGVRLVDNLNGTGGLAGTPAPDQGGKYTVTLSAGNAAGTVYDVLTFTVNGAPAINSIGMNPLTVGTHGAVIISTAGFPIDTITVSPLPPAGVTLVDEGNNTAELVGTPAAGTGGTYALTISASNVPGSTATEVFTLTVDQPPVFNPISSTTLTTGTAVTIGVITTGYPIGSEQLYVASTSSGSVGEYNPVTGAAVNSTFILSDAPNDVAQNGNDLYVGDDDDDSVGQYNASTGAAINASLITGLDFPAGIAIDGSGDLFVVNQNGGSIGKYDASTGAAISASFISGLSGLSGIAVAGNDLFVSNNHSGGQVSEYNATSGALIDASFISGLDSPGQIALDGQGDLFVTNTGDGEVGEYNVSDGSAVNADLVSGFTQINGIAVDGNDLYVADQLGDTVGEYNATTGVAINASLVSELSNPLGIAIGSGESISMTGGALPAGVGLYDNGNGTGELAGTPDADAGGKYVLTLSAGNATGSASEVFTLTVDQAPAFTGNDSNPLIVGTHGTVGVFATGFPAVTLKETGTLPSGVTFVDEHNDVGELIGTPGAGQGATYTVSVTATNVAGTAAPQIFTLTVNQAPKVASVGSNILLLGTAGSINIVTTGFPADTITEAGALDGLSLSSTGSNTASISGTPADSGKFVATIIADNGVGVTASQVFTLTVYDGAALSGSNPTAATFQTGTAGTVNITTTGFPAPTITETGKLPSGVILKTATNGTAEIVGAPAATTGGTYNIMLSAANVAGTAAPQAFMLTVNQPPAIVPSATVTLNTGMAGSINITTTGFPAASFGLVLDGSPISAVDGLTLNSTGTNTAQLLGAPTNDGIQPVTLSAANAAGTVVKVFTFKADQPPGIGAPDNTVLTLGTFGTVGINTTGFPGTQLTVTGLPRGLTNHAIDTDVFQINGTPAAGTAGTYNITLEAGNGLLPVAMQVFTLTIDQPPTTPKLVGSVTTFAMSKPGTIGFTTTGFPVPAFSETGLPSGLTLHDDGNATALVEGTPAPGTGTAYSVMISAGSALGTATETLTLTVDQAPAFNAIAAPTFSVGVLQVNTFTTTGYPVPTVSDAGSKLPGGVSFSNVNGTATLQGTPAAGTAGTYKIVLTAGNGITPNASQTFTLTVEPAAAAGVIAASVRPAVAQPCSPANVFSPASLSAGNALGGLTQTFSILAD